MYTDKTQTVAMALISATFGRYPDLLFHRPAGHRTAVPADAPVPRQRWCHTIYNIYTLHTRTYTHRRNTRQKPTGPGGTTSWMPPSEPGAADVGSGRSKYQPRPPTTRQQTVKHGARSHATDVWCGSATHSAADCRARSGRPHRTACGAAPAQVTLRLLSGRRPAR